MTPLKISVIAPDASALERLKAELPAVGGAESSAWVGSVDQLCSAVLQERPDLIVAELGGAGERELAALERALAGQPHTALILLASECSPEFLLRAMQAGVREVVPKPLKPGELREAFLRQYERLRTSQASPRKAGRLLAFVPTKGGCGTTFLATSFAHALSLRGRRVAVIDLNLSLGDAAIFIAEAPPSATLAELCAQQHRLDASLLEASMAQVADQLWLLAAPEPELAGSVRADSVAQILDLARLHFDFVIVDTGRALDAVTLQALDMADTVVVVAQAMLPFIHNGRRLMQVLRELGYGPQKLELVINRVQKGGHLSPSELRRSLQFEKAREIPNSYDNVMSAIDHGLPLLAHAPKDPAARALAAWAEALAPAPKGLRAGPAWMRGLGLMRS